MRFRLSRHEYVLQHIHPSLHCCGISALLFISSVYFFGMLCEDVADCRWSFAFRLIRNISMAMPRIHVRI